METQTTLVSDPTPVMANGNGRRELDAYYTPDELALACLRWLVRDGFYRAGTVLEPSCGRGAFVRAARVYTARPIVAVDIAPERKLDALAAGAATVHIGDFLGQSLGPFDLIVGNPPFSGAEPHVRHAFSHRGEWGSVAFLLRLAFLESKERRDFWRENPASKVYVFSERPSFTGGRTDSAAYGLFVWQRGWTRPTELEVVSWR